MKKYLSPILFSLIILCESSCKKDNAQTTPLSSRTITFILYTEKDFSADEHNITFSLLIKNHLTTLFDSSLSTIKIKDIPAPVNKLIIEKKIPDDGSAWIVGFQYNIENVGYSWYLDSCAVGQSSKTVEFAFQ